MDRKVAKTTGPHYHTPDMDNINSNEFNVSKLVFLGILLAAIVAAWTVSTSRTTLIMEPVAPVCDELTVSMPAGASWQSASKGSWVYNENAFLQKSVHGNGPDCTVEVRYQLGPITGDVNQYLSAASRSLGLEVASRGQQNVNGIEIMWAAFASPDEQPHFYYAVAPLGAERTVTVLVWGKPGTSALVESVFEPVIKSLKYKDTGLLKKGAEIVSAIQETGLAALPEKPLFESFLIKDSAGKPTGFYFTKTATATNPQEAVFEIMYYKAAARTDFYRIRFSTPNLKDYVWYTWNPRNPSFGATVKVENSVLGAGVRGYPRRSEFNLSDAAFADAIIEQAAWQMIKTGVTEAVIDSVNYDGSIDPAHITLGKAPVEGDKWKHSVRLASMADPKVYSEIFFDIGGTIVRRTEHRQETDELEQMDSRQIMTLFPQLAGEITQFQNGNTDSGTGEKEVDYGRRPI